MNEPSPPTAKPRVTCPCCGFRTLAARKNDEICKVCFWQDDGQDDPYADELRGGPNGKLTLTQARANFVAIGAVERRFVRSVWPPRPDEM
jgi:hypothetical protein